MTASTFGVFRNGQMSDEAWSELEPSISSAFHRTSCQAGFGNALRKADPEFVAIIEDSARANGITNELLDKVAPHAEGDSIIVFQIYGDVPSQSGRPRRTLLAHGGGHAHSDAAPHNATTRSALQISASVFSSRRIAQ